jgi:hypothetical protein
VKARSSSQGPWTFGEFFGVLKRKVRPKRESKKAPTVRADAIAPLMLLHHGNFGDNCAGLAFVTNSGLHPDLSAFLQVIASSESAAGLPEAELIAFEQIVRAYTATEPKLVPSAAHLFSWLHGLKIHTDQGQLADSDAALLELADVVVEFSEIELLQRQAKQIAREIVNRVRIKVAHTTTIVPTCEEQLKHDKGIVISELLGVLSLSTEAYEQLKAGAGNDVVKTLSRMQRYCMKNRMTNSLVQICDFKAQWDIWRTIERHFLKSADYVLLESKAQEILKAGLTIERIVAEAKDVAKQFSGLTATALTPEHVMGLIFSLAAQSEAISA